MSIGISDLFYVIRATVLAVAFFVGKFINN